MRTRALVALVVGAVVAWDDAARPAAQQPQFRAGVDLVQIDVVALDQSGHPVRGLTAADFTLLDRQKAQRISTFKEVALTGPAAAISARPASPAIPGVKDDIVTNQIPAADRLVVMVLDDFHTFRQRSDRVKDLAHKVANALGPQSSMAVLFTSGRHSTEFTRDPADISAAIDAFVGAAPGRRPSPGSDDPRTPFKGDPLAPAPPYSEKWDLGNFFSDLKLPNAIHDAARLLLGAESGRKAFVLISENVGNDLTGMFKSSVPPCEHLIDPRSPHPSPCFYEKALQSAVDSLEQANITLYAFDPRGAVSDQDVPLECAPGLPGQRGRDPCVGDLIRAPDKNYVRYAQNGLSITAEAAGGFAVTNSDDFDGGIARLREEIDHYYLLGFSPTDPTGRGFRPVTVTVNRPGVTLHYRRGYVLGPAETPPASADPLVALSAGLVPRTDLPLRLMAMPLGASDASAKGKPQTRVLALVEATVPRGTATELRYGLVAVNLASGQIVSNIANAVTFPATPAGTGTRQDLEVELPIEVLLPPGRYQLRASALESGLEKGGSVYLTLQVPDLTAGALVVGNPLLGTTARAAAMASGPGVVKLPFTPTLDRVFDETDVLRVFCPLVARPGRPPTATLDVLGKDDTVALSATPVVGAAAVTADISLTTLDPGPYTLRLRVTDGAETTTRVVPLVIR
jgi:VWFA-related protein